MVDHLHSDEAKMVALFIEAILYGIYLVSLGFVLVYVLRTRDGPGPGKWKWRRPSGVRVATLGVAVMLWVNSTLNLGWGLMRQMRVYIFEPRTKKPTWIDLAKPSSVIVQTMTADIFLTYRCWIVYGRSLKVALFPFVMSLGSLGVFVWIMVIQTQVNSRIGTVSREINISAELMPLSIAQFSITVALNVYATSMIVYRITKIDRSVAGGLSSTLPLSSTRTPDATYRQPKTRMRLQKVMQIIIESALIYTLASALAFVTIVKYESNAQYITTAVNIIVVGLTFNLIAIRLAQESRRVDKWKLDDTKLTTLRFEEFPSRNCGEESGTDLESLTSMQFSPNPEPEKNTSSVRLQVVEV